jgi:hypothetical protein
LSIRGKILRTAIEVGKSLVHEERREEEENWVGKEKGEVEVIPTTKSWTCEIVTYGLVARGRIITQEE